MKKYSFVIVSASALALFLVFSMTPQGRESVADALIICAKRLVPSLFISVCVSVFLMKSGLFAYIPKKLSLITGELFGIPPEASSAVIIGFLCGFPSGAIAVSSLYGKKLISEYDARRLAAISSVPSPTFIIGYVGSELLESALLGVGLYFSVVLSSLTLGIFTARGQGKLSGNIPKTKPEILSSIAPSIAQSVLKTVTLCGFVIFFSAFAKMLSMPFSHSKIISYAVYSAFEISKASVLLSSLSDVGIALVALSAALAFSGFSAIFQVISVTDFPIGEYIKLKTVAAVLSAAFSFVLFFCRFQIAVFLFAAYFAFLFFGKKLIHSGKYKQNSEHNPKNIAFDMPHENR